MRIEILHERDPDSGCDITVWVDGVEIAVGDDATWVHGIPVQTDVVNIDPGAGHTSEDWDESRDFDVADERGRSFAFKSAVAQAYDQASDSKYID